MLEYLRLTLAVAQVRNLQLNVKKRCLLFITIACEADADWDAIRNGVRRSWRPWFKTRTGMTRFFGVITDVGGERPHVHIIAECDRHLVEKEGRRVVARAGDLWARDHPASAAGWAQVGPTALHAMLLRDAGQVQPDRLGPALTHAELKATPATDKIVRRSISHARYFVRHVPVPTVPKHKTFVIASRNFAPEEVGTYPSFRDDWAETEVGQIPLAYLDEQRRRHPQCSYQDLLAKRAPRYTKVDRKAFGRAIGEYRKLADEA